MFIVYRFPSLVSLLPRVSISRPFLPFPLFLSFIHFVRSLPLVCLLTVMHFYFLRSSLCLFPLSISNYASLLLLCHIFWTSSLFLVSLFFLSFFPLSSLSIFPLLILVLTVVSHNSLFLLSFIFYIIIPLSPPPSPWFISSSALYYLTSHANSLILDTW